MTRQTFEEHVAGSLDALYQGALFLAGGDRSSAERLLVDSMTHAFRQRTSPDDPRPVERQLEAGLVRGFVARLDGPADELPRAQTRTSRAEPAVLRHARPDRLFAAVSAVPEWARAALWLVLLRRWSYADAASTLGVDKAVLTELLRYRERLLDGLVDVAGSSGTEGVGG